MKKQGPPATLEQLGIGVKRKSGENGTGPAKKRRRSDEEAPKKLVKLDRALRQDKDEKKAPKQKTKPQKLPNPNVQALGQKKVPSPAAKSTEDLHEDEVEDVDGVEAVALDDAELNEASLSEDEVNAMALDELEEAQSDLEASEGDSVFDSDIEDDEPKGMFSEDEDDSDALETLTAANIEGLSNKLDREQAQVEEEAQQELEDEAMRTNLAGDEGVLDTAQTAPGLAPDLALVRTRMTETIRILGNFSKLADKTKSRTDYTTQLLADICTYYGYTPYLAEKLFSLFTPAEAFAFFEANETPRPVVLRTNTLRTNRRSLAQALINRGVVLEPVGKWSKVGLQVFESPVPLGATPEYLAGHYILQAASSFLPVMALAPQANERILDMAAAPGGKTTYISSLMRNTGAVFANDANRQRAKGLIGNIHRLGCKNVVVCNYEAQKAFPKLLGGFDRVLLDAPCSGTGVIGKDPSVKTSKNERDFLALPHMQKQLLLAAIDSVDHTSKTGGYVVYSTCSVTVEENEGVVQYILRKRPNVKIVDTGLGTFGSEGFRAYESKKFDDKMNLTRRYFPHKENVDGFFVCKLKKIGPMPKAAAGQLNGNAETEVVKTPVVNGEKKLTNGASTEDEAVVEDDNFGGFDDKEDQEIIEKAEKKWLKARGLDPKAAEKKAERKEKMKDTKEQSKPQKEKKEKKEKREKVKKVKA